MTDPAPVRGHGQGPGRGPGQEGVVDEFDPMVGLGRITAGSHSYEFHCTQISDGSRTIEVGATVTFSVRAGRLGQWEAVDIVPAASPGGGQGRVGP